MIARRNRNGAGDPPAGWRQEVVACAAAAAAIGVGASRGFEAAFLLLAALAVSWSLVPPVARFALRRNAIVAPGGRSIHRESTPLLGGLAVFLPLLAVILIQEDPRFLGLALGCTVLAAAGAYDDLRGASPRMKILAQVVAALCLVVAGTRMERIELPPFGGFGTHGFEIPLLVFWVVLVTNAINLIDGMDGLAATVALVACLACVALGWAAIPAAVLAGALLGFLRHNLPRASVFMGDAGSMIVGFCLAAFALQSPTGFSPAAALGILALPVGDVALSAGRRWLRGKPIFTGDCGHVHHLLLRAWGDPWKALATLAAFAFVTSTVAVASPNAWGLLWIALLWAGFGVVLLFVAGRPRWASILINRRLFQRAHLVRRYAQDSLRIAESASDVAALLDRIAAEFNLLTLRVRGISIDRSSGGEGEIVEENVECASQGAGWSRRPNGDDPAFREEVRTILCELIRKADTRLGALGADPAPGSRLVTRYVIEPPRSAAGPEEVPVPPRAETGFRLNLPRAHFVAGSRLNLLEVAPLVEETRRRAVLDPFVVHTGRRDELGLDDVGSRGVAIVVPDVDLDVPPAADGVETARILERYDALLDACVPGVVVVVGSSNAAVACAVVAKKRGIPVAHIDAGGSAPDRPAPEAFNRALAGSLADLLFSSRPEAGGASREPSRASQRVLFAASDPSALEPAAARLVPALEELAGGGGAA
ncbi:MAG: UDP-N-acetylglucosamine 2-epimerase [Planctomycetaceae bacterium]